MLLGVLLLIYVLGALGSEAPAHLPSIHALANTSANRLGNTYDFWTYGSDGFDLTRGNSTGAKSIQAKCALSSFVRRTLN